MLKTSIVITHIRNRHPSPNKTSAKDTVCGFRRHERRIKGYQLKVRKGLTKLLYYMHFYIL